jgi:hypothetical protein
VSAAFWTLLWGPIGLLLSTPLTVCLVVLGRHVERLQFLDVMLGDRPALAPEESFYQRILADDPVEVAEQAELFLKTGSLTAFYDEVALKGLALAQADASRGALDEARRRRAKETIDEVIEDLADHDDVAPPAEEADEETPAVAAPPPPVLAPDGIASSWRGQPVLCVAGRSSLDEAAAALLAQLLDKHGVGARVLPSQAVSAANLPHLDTAGVRMICLSYLDVGSLTHARYLARRLRRKMPEAPVLLGFWTLADEDEGRRGDALRATGADRLVTSFRETVEHVVDAARQAEAANEPAAPSAAEKAFAVRRSPQAAAAPEGVAAARPVPAGEDGGR